MDTTVQRVGLSGDEFRQVVRACRWVLVGHCPPVFDLRRFLVERLRPPYPETATKIAALNDRQLCLLCQELVEQQRLAH